MEIKTKFNVGDKVFTIDNNSFRIKEFKVGSMMVFFNDTGNLRTTLYPTDDYMSSYDEDRCFPTKEDLLKYING